MIKILSKPYPFLFSIKRNIVIAASVGLLVFSINMLMSDEKVIQKSLITSQPSLSLLFGSISFFSIIFTFEIIPKTFISKIAKDNWTVSKELGLISLLLSIIIALNFTLILLVSKDESSISYLDLFIKLSTWVFIIGLIPSSIVIWANYTIKLKENLKQVEQHNKKLRVILQYQKDENTTISIPSDNKTESIDFNLEHLLFIKSDGNYVEIYLQENDQVSKLFHRASLRIIEEKLNRHTTIVRTHRSYIVNCRNIKFSKGTARNYQLFFPGIEQSVPVARNKFQVFNETIQNLKAIQNK